MHILKLENLERKMNKETQNILLLEDMMQLIGRVGNFIPELCF
jgi:hypothetical protein